MILLKHNYFIESLCTTIQLNLRSGVEYRVYFISDKRFIKLIARKTNSSEINARKILVEVIMHMSKDYEYDDLINIYGNRMHRFKRRET